MSWTPPNHMGADRMLGLDVYGQDDEQIGRVDEVMHPVDLSEDPQARYLLIKSNLLTGWDLYVPEAAVQSVEDDRIILRTTSEEIDTQEWTRPPEGFRLS